MYKRDAEEKLLELSRSLPVVTITGPRQAGKTTLVKKIFGEKPYVNLEDLDQREFALSDPRKFLGQFPDGAIIDEVQHAPDLLSYIQVIVDEKDPVGMFILTGSEQLAIHQAVVQSLAGRVALFNLYPMSLNELQKASIHLTLDEAIYTGGYPRLFAKHLNPSQVYKDYIQTYLERDLRKLTTVKDLSQFQKFLRLCAGRIGQLLNLNSLAGDVGVSTKTIQHWISILEASFILIRLQPYYENFGKRSIKAPKLYFSDVGLACYLLGIYNTDQLSRDPLRGCLVENLIFLELLKTQANQAKDPDLYFFRDAHGHEVDFIFKHGRELYPVEVKAAQTFHLSFLKSIEFFQGLAQERCQKGFLVYAGEIEQPIHSIEVLNYKNACKIISISQEQ